MQACDQLTTWLVVATVPLLTLVAWPTPPLDASLDVNATPREESVSHPVSHPFQYRDTPFRVHDGGQPMTWSL